MVASAPFRSSSRRKRGRVHGEGGGVGDVAAAHLHAQGLVADAPAAAGRAGTAAEEALVVLAHVLGLRLAHAAHHGVHGALVAHAEGAAAVGAAHMDAHAVVAGTVQDHLAHGRGQEPPRLVEVDAALARHRAHHVRAPARALAHRAQRLHRALVDGQAGGSAPPGRGPSPCACPGPSTPGTSRAGS